MTRYAISQPVRQVEAPRLLTGQGRYTDDIQLLNQCHAVFLRSPVAHADIKSIDTRAANQMPGVIAVLTGAELTADGIGPVPGNSPPKRRDGQPGYRPKRPAITSDRVRHVGQIVACVIAERINDAKDACEAIEIEYEALPVLTDAAIANKPGAIQLWDDLANNEAFFADKGNAEETEKAIAAAPNVVKGRFRVSRVTANTMEPRAVTAQYDPGLDHYTVWACQQRPFVFRTMMTKGMFKIPETNMTVIAGDVGGSFGMKGGLYPEVPLIAYAAKKVGRPVKWVCERSEAHIADDQARDVWTDAELAFDDDGKFLAVRFDSNANIGAFLSMTGFGTPNGVATAMGSTYRIPAMHGRSAAVMTNTQPMANYRGPSGTPGVYVLERLIDMAAEKLKLDPTEIRRRNYLKPTDLPYKHPVGIYIDSGEFERVMDKCLELADYKGAQARKKEAEARGKLYGIGVSSSIDPSGSPAPETAELRFDPGGTVTVLAASTAGGQSHATIYTQIVSQTLGIDAEKIRVVEGDTSRLAWGSGTGAARTATLCGSVVLMAAEKTREKARKIAAHMMETTPENTTFEDGTFYATGTNKTVTFDEVAKASFNPKKVPPGMEFGLFETAAWTSERANIPNTFHVCEVEIDPDTGMLEFKRYNIAYDVGVELNPLLVQGQALGAIAQGVGQAIKEQILYDEDGQNLTGSFMDYCMPRANDFCMIGMVSHPVPTEQNPLGVKGAGEGGTVGSLAAAMNAVSDALRPVGVEHIEMPCTPYKIWKAIQDAKGA
ncbi:MAG: hypothetical protein RLZ98_1925 [Pseudomonadota bacterium]|jgi:carbon-monoxide dehydrogenase large subunit